MYNEFKNKVAIVTGGASGIGRASAVLFSNYDAKVVIADINNDGAKETVSLIKNSGKEACFFKTDVSIEKNVKKLVDFTIKKYGRLDYAHNNAGIEGGSAVNFTEDNPESLQNNSYLLESTEEQWDKVININLKGIWLCMKYQIPEMIKAGKGAIVNTSSIAGLVGIGQASYIASKHGIVGLTKVAGTEFIKKNIRVNAVCPSLTVSGMTEPIIKYFPNIKNFLEASTPIGRMATAEEIANVALWLCSDSASYITGQSVAADGGLTAL